MKLKKPKFWDFKKPNFLSFLLLIFTVPLLLNNFFLNLKNKKKIINLRTICIGNIYLGGTGKTPTTIELYKILKKQNYNVSTAKKFYKSQEDEQNLLKKETDLICYDTRKSIIHKAIHEKKEVLIFDDGLQDKNITYDMQFVCFDSNTWIGNGQLIPAGPLREKISSLKKYDGVFLKNSKNKYYNEILKNINSRIEIFNTEYQISNLNQFNLNFDYMIFSGIGNPNDFKNILVENKFNIKDELIYPDHFNYTLKDIEFIKKRANDINAGIITTEKDYMRIKKENRNGINFLKINLKIHDEKRLINFINDNINDKS
tara:strand:- start:7007 stop:7951 length:945 start_codon:yes stop_codon:yes gene_type:complete